MRAAVFIPVLNLGGAEKVILELVNSWRTVTGDKIILFTDIKRSSLISLVDNDVVLSHISSRNYKLASCLELRIALKNWNVEILYTHLTHSNILGVVCSYKICKVIAVEHSITSIYLARQGFKGRFLAIILKFFLSRCHRVVAVSESVKTDLVREFKMLEDKVVVVKNPIDFKAIHLFSKHEIDNELLNFLNGRKYIITVGRYHRDKRQLELVRELRYFLLKTDVVLVILGEGEMRLDLEREIESLNLTSNVYLSGYVKNPYSYIARAVCVVHASLYEGFGLSVIESVYLRKYVIMTDFDGAKSLISNFRNGIILNSISDIACALEVFYESSSDFKSDGLKSFEISEYSVFETISSYYNLCF